MKKRSKNNYIDNEKFYIEVVKAKQARAKALELGKQAPILPDYIGECFMLIARNLARMPRFSSYSYVDEMIEDGIENCILYWYNFDEVKYKNPHTYFTTITYYAFLRRIAVEKKEQYTKYKFMTTVGLLEHENLTDSDGNNILSMEVYENISKFIEDYEKKRDSKVKLKK